VRRVLFDLALQGSRDNMSVVIVAFEGAPEVSDEAKEKESELDSRLELKVKGDRRESFILCTTVHSSENLYLNQV